MDNKDIKDIIRNIKAKENHMFSVLQKKEFVKMYIVDRCGILKKIISEARSLSHKEHGALGIAGIGKECYVLLDGCMIEEVGGQEEEENIRIPASVSYALLQSCVEREKIPIIIHTHGISYNGNQKLKVSFSNKDMSFIDKFTECAKKIGNISECIFIVTDGTMLVCCYRDMSTEEYKFFEGEAENKYGEQIFCCI